jgi:hypothetical protein
MRLRSDGKISRSFARLWESPVKVRNPYGFQQNQMWPPSPAHQSPQHFPRLRTLMDLSNHHIFNNLRINNLRSFAIQAATPRCNQTMQYPGMQGNGSRLSRTRTWSLPTRSRRATIHAAQYFRTSTRCSRLGWPTTIRICRHLGDRAASMMICVRTATMIMSYEVNGMMSTYIHESRCITYATSRWARSTIRISTPRVMERTLKMDNLSFQQVSGCIRPGRGVGVSVIVADLICFSATLPSCKVQHSWAGFVSLLPPISLCRSN